MQWRENGSGDIFVGAGEETSVVEETFGLDDADPIATRLLVTAPVRGPALSNP